ncbi:rab-GTPase-TBC domain-containing protein [Rhodotorula diobovata]|uniref:Rab-GTPase-TBC domain-containing protein n=1 Tax=Rhodotorula diobovata TaxID=5288 RepID=A0A5C5FLM5_9BASI|nr:rab-GTPase-TBC domain-containing protein [Rhodotorula diobovata]
MPLWSRTPQPPPPSQAARSPPATQASLSTSPPPPPGFLANHHRRSSSNLDTAHTRAPSGPGSPGRSTAPRLQVHKAGKGRAQRTVAEADELGADDEPWDTNSDEEHELDPSSLVARIGGVSLSIPASSSSGAPQPGGAAGSAAAAASTPVSPTSASASASATTTPTSSSWSFNPFRGASVPAPAAPVRTASGSSSLAAAEAVAAALSGRGGALSARPAPPMQPQRGASYLAGASRVQEEADKVVRAEEQRRSLERGETKPALVDEPEEMDVPGTDKDGTEEDQEGEARKEEESEREEKGEGWAKEQCRRAIRRDVDELVKDPAHVLERLKVAWAAPTAPPAPTAHRASISSVVEPSPNPNKGPADDDDDDDDDPTRGYVQLDAPALSSTDPSIVEFDAPPPNPEEEGERGREKRRRRKFLDVLASDNVDLGELRKLAWSGVPDELRTMVWQLLLGYLPAPLSRRAATLARKRSEYASLVRQAFSRGVGGLDGPIWHQISIDVPRTRPGVKLWMAEATQRSLERVLYVWAIRHPASGYVQGINDLVTPFFQVFLQGYIDADPETFDVSTLPPSVLEALEADSFWCLSKLLDGIQDNYIFAQPGIQRLVKKMDGLCARVDAPLAAHLKEQGVEFIQFAFRWMNCLLMRELSVKNIVRMWDTYLAEGGDAFSEFHLYVCLAFLVRWSDTLREMDFQSIIIFLQSLPTQDWTDKDTELLLSEAFLWSRTFQAR